MKKNILIFGITSIIVVGILNGIVSQSDIFMESMVYGNILGAVEGLVLSGLAFFLFGKKGKEQEETINYLEELLNGGIENPANFDEKYAEKYADLDKNKKNEAEMEMIKKKLNKNKEFLLEKTNSLENILDGFEEKVKEQNGVYRKVIANIEKTTGEVQEITAAANVAAETSLKTLELTSSTVELATSGVENVEKSLIKMGEIKENTDTTADSVGKLEEKANEIGGIIVSITKISEQTNLLALNAAIEAARAGEAGKGFAVVAQEIRGLADESRKAAENINNIVAVIQSQTQQAVKKMNKTLEVVAEGSESSSSVGESLTIMLDSISKINNMMQDVAAGAQQQSANTHEIANQMDINSGFINDELENIEKLNNFISGQREIIEDMRDKIEIEETLIQGINKSNNKNKGIEKRIRVKE